VQGNRAPRRTWRRKGSHDHKDHNRRHRGAAVRTDESRKSTETKSAYKTTELIVYALAVLGVLIASMIVDQSFGADPA